MWNLQSINKGDYKMNINTEINNGKLIINLEGRLDTNTAPQLEDTINQQIENITELLLNLKNLEYISSAGLRVILSAQKIMNKQGKMKIINANDNVMEVFDMTGFLDILDVE